MGERFQDEVGAALATRPFMTSGGQVNADLVAVSMGFPGGRHDPVSAWHYVRRGTDLEMVFGFYSNFTPHDLICKVIKSGEYPESGEGASVQFNSDRCVRADGDSLVLVHHGGVTVRSRVSRAALIKGISELAPTAMVLAGIRDAAPGSWPVKIGTTRNIPDLLDNVFCFAYCVEQAKRQIRGECALAPLS